MNNSEFNHRIAIIGGGSAGAMACLRAALNNDSFIFFPGTPKDKKKSRALWVRKVENIPGYFNFKRSIEDPNLEALNWIETSEFSHRFTWMKNTGIKSIVKTQKGFELKDSKDQIHHARFILLATGGMDIQPEIGGSIQPILPFANAQTVDYCIRCDGHHVYKQHTTVIGHDSGAVWVGAILHERYSPPSMTILTNGEKPDFSEIAEKLIKAYKFNIIEDKISEVLGDPKAGLLEGFKLQDGKEVNSTMCFISLGMMYYNELANSLGAKIDDSGCVITNEKGLTDIKDFYVAGDLRAGIKNQIYTAWDSAVDALDHMNSIIRREKREKAFLEFESN